LEVVIKYYVWNVWGKSFMRGWRVGKGKVGGNIGNGDTSKDILIRFGKWIEVFGEGVCCKGKGENK